MEIFFSAKNIGERGKGLTFNDVLLVPRHGDISSRRDPSLETKVTKNYSLGTPFISANMDTVTESEMALAMAKRGGLGILHRFMDPKEQVEQVKKIREGLSTLEHSLPLAASIGVKEDGKLRADLLADAGVEILTIDIAHGDSVMMLEILDHVKKKYPKIDIIAGNVATTDATRRLIEHGADAVKVGIGPGSMCTTRIITGHGVPQLTAVALCALEASKFKVPVIADGGLKNSGDVVKALSAGASTVMVGSLVAGTLETPGEMKSGKKRYRGMASKDAQVSWRGDLPKGMVAEGEATEIPCKGSVHHIIEELEGGLRSGMTYMGAMDIKSMVEKAQFVEMSGAGLYESRPHGLNF
ncbi:MAG: IMP dehydrogenase [Bdellovibrionota bacterium]|nr:IMP dehydrogenase [Bdellovibrionota bacterium]|tara:strand:- start:13103 stop:14167 length:1065 start_codon:yes stop_codon:yes gene_type:complete